MYPGMVNQVHVMNARGAGSHASQTGQATINVLYHLGGSGAVIFQHIFDEIDATPGTICFIAQQDIGGAGRCAKAAVDTGAENIIGCRKFRVGQLDYGEMCLHQALDNMLKSSSNHAARVEEVIGIEAVFNALGQR